MAGSGTSPRPERPGGPRWRRVLKWVLLIGIGVPVASFFMGLIVIFGGANTGFGQRFIEREAKSLTGGMIQIDGLAGTFPQNLRISRLRVSDARGTWLELDGFHIMWSPLAIVRSQVSVHTLSADRLAISRLPVSSAQTQPSSSSAGPSSLHLGVTLDSVHVGRIAVGEAVAGIPAQTSLDGYAHLQDLADVLNGPTLATLPVAKVGLNLHRLDKPGWLKLSAETPKGAVDLHLALNDGKGGFLGSIAQMATLSPEQMHLVLHGPLKNAAVDFDMTAGPTKASISGVLNLLDQAGKLKIHAHAPSMTVMPNVAWNGLDLDASLDGPLKMPKGEGRLDLEALSAAGAGVGHLTALFSGQGGATAADEAVKLTLKADGLRLPGTAPTLLASAPLTAEIVAHPGLPSIPVSLVLSHPLVGLTGNVALKPAPNGALTLTLPDLGPLAAIGGVALKGNAAVNTQFALASSPEKDTRLSLDGTVGITGGLAQAKGLIGPDGKIHLDVASHITHSGQKDEARIVEVKDLAVDGAAVHLVDKATALLGQQITLNTDLGLKLPDLKAISPKLNGDLDLDAHVEGPTDDLSGHLATKALFGTVDIPQAPLALDVAFAHAPQHVEATVKGSGKLDGSALDLDLVALKRPDGAVHVDLNALSWKTAQGKGALTLPAGAVVPLGSLDIGVRNLSDFSRLAGQKIGGHLAASLRTDEAGNVPVAHLTLDGAFSALKAQLKQLKLAGDVKDPAGKPVLDLSLAAKGLKAADVAADASASLKGPLSALDIGLHAKAAGKAIGAATVDTALRLNLDDKTVALKTLAAAIKGEKLALLGPAVVSFGDKTGVDHLKLRIAPPKGQAASIDLAGTVKPKLDINAQFAHITPALAAPFAPTLKASGSLDGQARITGSPQKPEGTITVRGRGLHMDSGTAASLPAASLDLQTALDNGLARIKLTLAAGKQINLAVQGTAPAAAQGTLDLHTTGKVDLTVADAVLGAKGIATAGTVAIDMAIAGTLAAPKATGRIDLRKASVNDYAQGARLYDINGSIVAQGDTLAFQNFVAHAGDGTIGVSGSIGAFRPGIPLDIHIKADKAQPVASDLLTARINTDLRIHGQATTRIDVDGNVKIPTATINIPDSMPASVPQLDVIRPGDDANASAGSSMVIGLDVNVLAPGEFFVRGHGLDAVMSGKLHVGGTASTPVVDGGFDLQRGNFNLAGVNLNFTHGRVGFNGSGVNHKLDPTLDFRADRNVQGTLASLLVTGYASAPKIDFKSNPEQPRDQVLAMLLFGTTTAKLSTTQLAELAAAVAQLTGGSGFDPLGTIRNSLGLDRLAIGGGNGVGNGGTSVEAGKYVMKGVYVGAKQATSGSGTQAQVQVDLTRHLKLNTTVGTGGQVTGFTTPENDPGSSVGLSWGIDY